MGTDDYSTIRSTNGTGEPGDHMNLAVEPSCPSDLLLLLNMVTEVEKITTI